MSSLLILSPPPSIPPPLTVGGVSLRGRSVLEDDGHQGLANGALPCLGHLPPHAAIGRHVAGRGRGSLGEGGVGGSVHVGVLAHEVAHGARDDLKAVRPGAGRDQGEVTRRTHLQDL